MTIAAAESAQTHWNESPLLLSPTERYRIYPWLPKIAEFADHRGQRVLEVGCGTGCDLLQFAQNGAIAIGVDITENHLQLARQRVGNSAEVKRADARQLPFPDATFEYVYSHGVIHHSDEPNKIVAEILRVLKPGGKFNVHVYAKWSYFPLLLMLRYGMAWKLYIENSRTPVYIDFYTARSLRRLFPVPITIEKRGFPAAPAFQRSLGWYLIAKGNKPN